MDIKKHIEAEAKLLVEHLKVRGDHILNTVSVADRPVLERSLTRAAVLGGELLLDPANQAARDELASVVNTLKFMEAKYAITAAREVREFVNLAMQRVTRALLSAVFAAI